MPKGRPLGSCTVCRHLERARIELALAGGASRRALARKYGLDHNAVGRHWANHVGEQRKVTLRVGPVGLEALAARAAEESSSVLDQFKAVRAGLWELYDAAVSGGDANGAASLAARLHENLGAIAKLTGELIASPLIQQNTVNVFMHDPAFAVFQSDLIRALSRFPDARAAVIETFDRLEASAPPPLPALEHRARAG